MSTYDKSKPLSLFALIEAVGVDNIRVQNLLQSMTDIRTDKRGDSKVTFGTDQINATQVATNTTRMMGIILWLPKDLIPRPRAPEEPGR